MAWSLRKLFGRSSFDVAVRNAYIATVEQARQPGFYEAWSVPDSPIGRFDVIALHCFFVLHRLKGEQTAQKFSEVYCETLFDDMDRNLREMGVGDLSVGKKVRKLAEGFFGRAAAYETALAEDDNALCEVLRRNLYGEAVPNDNTLLHIANYVRRTVAALDLQDVADLVGGRISFAPLCKETD
jgi:cytochrome b pre-mRNA-processing protein 3